MLKCARAAGTVGQHFVAVFGAQQSALEALLLKRRIMGPSWLGLAQPVRVNSSVQASPATTDSSLASYTLHQQKL